MTYQERSANDPRGRRTRRRCRTDVEKGTNTLARADRRKRKVGRTHCPRVSAKRHRDRHRRRAGCGRQEMVSDVRAGAGTSIRY